MNLKEYFWFWSAELSPKFCDDIIECAKNYKTHKAEIGTIEKIKKEKGEVSKDEWEKADKKRKSDIVWLNEQWIWNTIHYYIEEANKNAGWNFDWDYSESSQFTKYKGTKKQHYGWHTDSWPEPYSMENENQNLKGKIRKLSCIVNLSEPEDYVGGNLQFDLRNNHDYEDNENPNIINADFIKPRGSIIIFPSFVWHRVTPVTKGIRYSLVNWCVGWPWR